MSLTDMTKTKAGRRLMGFMKVFNAGQSTALRDYIAAYTTPEALEHHTIDDWQAHLTSIYAATGPMRAVQVIAADEYRVIVLVQAQTNGAFYLVEMAVSVDYPHKVAEFIHKPA